MVKGNIETNEKLIKSAKSALIANFFEGKFEGEVYISRKSKEKNNYCRFIKYDRSVFQNPRNQFFTLDTTSENAFSLKNQGIDPPEIKK